MHSSGIIIKFSVCHRHISNQTYAMCTFYELSIIWLAFVYSATSKSKSFQCALDLNECVLCSMHINVYVPILWKAFMIKPSTPLILSTLHICFPPMSSYSNAYCMRLSCAPAYVTFIEYVCCILKFFCFFFARCVPTLQAHIEQINTRINPHTPNTTPKTKPNSNRS